MDGVDFESQLLQSDCAEERRVPRLPRDRERIRGAAFAFEPHPTHVALDGLAVGQPERASLVRPQAKLVHHPPGENGPCRPRVDEHVHVDDRDAIQGTDADRDMEHAHHPVHQRLERPYTFCYMQQCPPWAGVRTRVDWSSQENAQVPQRRPLPAGNRLRMPCRISSFPPWRATSMSTSTSVSTYVPSWTRSPFSTFRICSGFSNARPAAKTPKSTDTCVASTSFARPIRRVPSVSRFPCISVRLAHTFRRK